MDHYAPSGTLLPVETPAPADGLALLSDPVWLENMLADHGERSIARMVGCDRKTVTEYRRSHGIPARPPGPRRGVVVSRHVDNRDDLPESLRLLAERFEGDRAAPTTRTFRTRIVDLSKAQGDIDAEINAWIDICSIGLLNIEHKLALRRAA